MKLLSFLFGALALPLAAGTAPDAVAAPSESAMFDDSPFEIFPVALGMPEMAGVERREPPVLLAQASDPRVGQLEEQVRQLNGRIEELNFQILQMQEGLRKMQEDVDFRLQDIEQKRGETSAPSPKSVAEAPAEDPAPTNEVAGALPPPSAPGKGPGAAEKPLGSLVFDGQGNFKGGTFEATPPAEAGDAPDGETIVAALPPAADAQEVYRNAYEFMLSGDYGTAEAGFRDHIDRFPNDPQASDAHYWLGEALLGQQRYRDAAEVLIAANRTYPDSRKAPDMLLKLGVALAALNQREVACSTLAKVGQRYPKASASLKERVKQERALAGC